uniref:DUF5901 domain-containing protein n=1 Tax=viral metagenome TaxID=1070528 RepID=A0A6C0D5G0_9ZZZZ
MNSNNPLVKIKHNFVLDRKILFIDSNDRDKERWPNPAEFEINCPQNYNNVESLRLVNIMLPNFFYNISEQLQTNKMIVDISGSSTLHIIKLEDGCYNYTQLQDALVTKFKNINTNFENHFDISYNPINRKFTFIYNQTNGVVFNFRFDLPNNYSCIKDNYKTDVYAQHSNWGLGYILGFEKKKYTSYGYPHNGHTHQQLDAPNPIDLEDNKCVYIELEKYNKCDEIKPFLHYNYSNTNSGIVNSAFSKIPIYLFQDNKHLVNDGYFENVSYYQPPIDKIAKFKLKFRYHNGMLVDFHNFNVSLSLEINQIRNEMNNYDVRTPYKI